MNDYIVRTSRQTFAATLAGLKTAIAASGNRLFAEIDQKAAAQDVGLTLRPTTLLVFGNPKGGTPLMDAFPLIGLDLPLKLLVWEQRDGVKVAYTPGGVFAKRYSVGPEYKQIAGMDAVLSAVVDAVSNDSSQR